MAGRIATSFVSTLLRANNGIASTPAANKPARLLQLFDIENCPYCRMVREALTELDLDAEIYPCPKNGQRYREEVIARGGKAQFPYLVDPNTGVEMYESLDIIAYLFDTYAERELPLKWRVGRLQTLGSMMASWPRLNERMAVLPSRAPEYLLELYSFESSPYARPVRELLCNLELAYIVRNCGRTQADDWLLPGMRERMGKVAAPGQANRAALLEMEGRVAIPYLYDPNTERGLFESADILDYLEDNYAAQAL
ncbi:MAG: glutathione S-transferase N-terminal domain-containing protein [Gammaproteobacteria bacterium]|jgi:glutathione S-transferase|nr:glutathione S-transferase N-terminal domain-containing protein [Gammaproteobacteria bacterium]